MKKKFLSSLLLVLFVMGFNNSQARYQENAGQATRLENFGEVVPLQSFMTNFYEKQKESYSKKWPGVFTLYWTNDTSLDGATIILEMINGGPVYNFQMPGPGGGGDFGNIYEGTYNITIIRNDTIDYRFTAGFSSYRPGYSVEGAGTLYLYNVELTSAEPGVSLG